MRYLVDRNDIAQAINFGKHPVLFINMENKTLGEDRDFAVGCKVRIAWDDPHPYNQNMYSRCTLYHSEGKLGFLSDTCGLHNCFGRNDVLEMVEWAQAPLIHKGDEVVVVQDWPMQRMCLVQMMKMPNRFDKFCQVLATLEEMEG